MSVVAPAVERRDDRLEQVRDYWNSHIHDWKVARSEPGTAAFFEEIEAYRFEKLEYLARVVNFAGYPGKDVLDVGCGVGNDLSRFRRGGAHVTGVDLAPHSIQLAEQNFQQRGLDGTFKVMDGENLVFPDDSFDVVYCHTVLHFTPRPDRMVQEIHRVLKPGGEAILMTVNKRSWLNAMKVLASVQIDHLDSPVFYQFTATEFRNLLAPFSAVEIRPERFPVRTKVHKGLKARLYNTVFVDMFNLMPRVITRRTGHHLMAFCRK